MTKLLIMSDIHCEWDVFYTQHIQELLEAVDGVLITGDITNYGDKPVISEWYQAYGWFENLAKAQKPIYWIGGNHDFGAKQFASHASDFATFVENTVVKTPWLKPNGDYYTITGLNLSPCYNLPQLAQRWSAMTADPVFEEFYYENAKRADIVLSHCPPYEILDRVGKRHIGSKALGKYIERVKPLKVICGHVHESSGFKPAGAGPLLGTAIYNTAATYSVITL